MHFSLDVWNTIIKSNKTYSKLRNELVAERFNLIYEDAKRIFGSVKKQLDHNSEAFGMGLDSVGVYFELAIAIAKFKGESTYEICMQMGNLEGEFQRLFVEHTPHIPEGTVETICQLQIEGHTFSIGSNTNFITGDLLNDFLITSGICPSFGIYSDLVGIAKPHPAFFERIKFAYTFEFGKNDAENIIHVGDNQICDNPNGAMKHAFINGADDLAAKLKELVASA